MSDDLDYNDNLENHMQKQVEDIRLGTIKITKVVTVAIDDPTWMGELIRALGIYYVSSTEDVAQDMMRFDDVLDLVDFIDVEERKEAIKNVYDSEHFDYLIDFSDKLYEAMIKMFGKVES